VKYSIITFGCRVNQADSLAFEESLLAGGGVPSASDAAELVVVNTCSVTATADQGARQTIRRVARDNPSARIVVTGCYATRRPDEVGALPNVVRVVPNVEKPALVFIARTFVPTSERFGDGDGACGAVIQPGLAGRTAFTLRVQTGCAESCAYCIIPSTRGMPTSRSIADLLHEIERVAEAGFKEIALTGVHLGSYGRDLSPRVRLIDLLQHAEAAARRHGILLRVSSLEPMDCTREIVDLVAESEHIAPHFHLPLQHASDRVLASMRRPYTIAYYRALIDDIRTRIPSASIGSDVVVGFPGERDEDVDALVEYLNGSPLTHVHVFPYSDRPGTEATEMPGKVAGAAIRERAQRVRDVGRVLTLRFRAAQVGTVHRGLTLEDGSLVVTDNYIKVRIPSGHARNEWVDVAITGGGDPMLGEVVAGVMPAVAQSPKAAPASC